MAPHSIHARALSASAREGSRHPATKVYRLVPIPKGKRMGGYPRNGANRPSFGLGPWVGARVAPQQSPILRPGHFRL